MAEADDSRHPMPASIVLIATPEGWRHSILDTRGGMLCGRLRVGADATSEQARAAAVTMLREVVREFHDAEIEIAWDGPRPARTRTGRVIPLRRIGDRP
ncbi:hypothetical protein [Nocardia sp. NPDC047654]|uniref:hypothetical protein n=1 Tax=Nocardia sp. NPDC047654 TaxID=3364314 RepID=UPI0037234F65